MPERMMIPQFVMMICHALRSDGMRSERLVFQQGYGVSAEIPES
jgi:hypothetical protein